jgi:uncharacterized protein with GYD domain
MMRCSFVLALHADRERRELMPHYMYQLAYTNEAWATQVKNPRSFMERATPLLEELGGKAESAYYAFSDFDIVLIAELPDNVSMATAALAVAAGGAVKAMKTTLLMTLDEGVEAMRKAGASVYRPPSG